MITPSVIRRFACSALSTSMINGANSFLFVRLSQRIPRILRFGTDLAFSFTMLFACFSHTSSWWSFTLTPCTMTGQVLFRITALGAIASAQLFCVSISFFPAGLSICTTRSPLLSCRTARTLWPAVFPPAAKIHILVCDVSNLAILDHQPSFRTLAPGVR
jgi:hypothetical protein